MSLKLDPTLLWDVVKVQHIFSSLLFIYRFEVCFYLGRGLSAMLSGIYKLVSLHSLRLQTTHSFLLQRKKLRHNPRSSVPVGTFLVLNQCLSSGKKCWWNNHVLESDQKPINITSFDDYNGIFGVEGWYPAPSCQIHAHINFIGREETEVYYYHHHYYCAYSSPNWPQYLSMQNKWSVLLRVHHLIVRW
jgi:hypothetical protein